MPQQHPLSDRYTNDEIGRLHRHMRGVDRSVRVIKEAAVTRESTPLPTVTIPGWEPSSPGPAKERYVRYWHLVWYFPLTWTTPRLFALGRFNSDYKIVRVVVHVTEPYGYRGTAQLWTGRPRHRGNYIAKWRLPDADHGAQSFEPQSCARFGHVLCASPEDPDVLMLWLWKWTAPIYVGRPAGSTHVPGKMFILVNYVNTAAYPVEYEPTAPWPGNM